MTFKEIISKYNEGIKEIRDLLFYSNKEILKLDLIYTENFVKFGTKANGESIMIFVIHLYEHKPYYDNNRFKILKDILISEKEKLSYIKQKYLIDVIKIRPDFSEDITLFTEGKKFLFTID